MATYQFLSDEWVEAATAIREEYRGKSDQTPPPMKMNLVITEVPFGEDQRQAHIDTTDGEMEMELGHLEGEDLTVTVDYETAKAIFVDGNPQAGMQAFMAGQIKVQGDMTKMMALQTQQPDPVQLEAAARISEITD